MKKFGIDVDKFTKNDLLHIHKVPDLLRHPDGPLVGFEKFFNSIMPNPRPRFRLVGRAINDVSTQKGWQAEMQIEQFVHSNFDKINGMILCYYGYQDFILSETMSYVRQLCDHHNGVIFSSFAEPDFAAAIPH